MVWKETVTLEVWGVPFGLRSRIHTANLVRGFGSLQSIINNNLQQGDPNVMCIEVAVFGDTNVPQSVSVDSAPGGPLAVFSVIPSPLPSWARWSIMSLPDLRLPPRPLWGRPRPKSPGRLSWLQACRHRRTNDSQTPLESSVPGARSTQGATHYARRLPKKTTKASHKAPAHFNPASPPRLAELGKWCAYKAE